MTHLAIVAAVCVGQYGGGYVAGHCAHQSYGYCAGCVHHAYPPAAFTADPDHYVGVVAAALRKQAAIDAAAKAARDNAARLDARLAGIEAALKARPATPAPAPWPGPNARHFDRDGRELTPEDVAEIQSKWSVKPGPLPPDNTAGGPSLSETFGPPPGGDPFAASLDRCIGCHSADNPSGKLVLSDADGNVPKLDLWTRVKIHQRTKPDAPKRMPPKGDPLAPAARKVIADSIAKDLASIAEVIKE